MSVAVAITFRYFFRALYGHKPWICCWNFNSVCRSFRNINISGLGPFPVSVIVGTFFELAVHGRKLHVCRWNFDDVYHTSGPDV